MLYRLADMRLVGTAFGEVSVIYVRREDVEESLHDVIEDEPAWAGGLSVVEIPSAYYASN
jgi:hypothetical protein